MRVLKYNKPYRVNKTTIEDGRRLDNPAPQYYHRLSTIITKNGIVTASEMDWADNYGKSFFTLFSTVMNGYKYTAWLDEAKLSERNLKWMATHFIRNIQNDYLMIAFG